MFRILFLLIPWGMILISHIGQVSSSYRSTIFQSINTNRNNQSTTIRIGAPISFSPQDKYFSKGTLITNSWDLFVDWVNIERGGIKLNGTNMSVSIQIIEDYSNMDDVKHVTRYLLDEEKVDFMFAPYTSDLTNASAAITESEEFLLFSAVAHPYFPMNYTIYTLPTDLSRMKSTFHSFVSFGAKNISVITENDHDNCLLENTIKAAALEGITLYSHHTLDKKSATYIQDITNILIDLKENNVEVVIGCSISSLCTQIPTISRDINYNPDGIGFIACFSDPAIQASMGTLVDYLFDITPWAPLDNIRCNITGWTAAEFDERYFNYFSLRSNYHAASAFADCLILLAAIEETQSLDHDVLLTSIRSSTYQTMYATLSFSNGPQASFDALTEQMRYNYLDDTFELIVVSPPNVAQGSVFYPMPTWQAKKCMADTLYCSGHGTCSSAGVCICDANYYGKQDPNSCDAYCSGEMNSGICLEKQHFYIGGLVPYDIPVSKEFIAMMNLAVEMINNKSDGWYDNVKQVTFDLQVNDSGCDAAIAYNAVLDQTSWSKLMNDGKNLHGVIGDLCSDASASVASYGKSVSLPQVSYASTASSLSNVDLYPYFSRTCSSDEIQAESLVSLLEYIGLTPFIAILYRIDLDYSTNLASSFITRWREVDHTILFNFGFTADFTDFNGLVLQLAASGAQSVLLVLESPEIQLLWKATEDLQLLHEEIVWVAVESWASINFEESDLKRNGAIGLSFYESNEPTSLRFLDLWKSLDPEIYPDADGNRDRLEIYSGYIVDSVVALALAYQQAIEQQTNLGNDDFFRQYVYDVLCTEISFEGVSGHKEFTLYGNQVDNKFTIRSYYYYPASTSSSSSSSSMITKYSNEEEMVSNWMNIGFLNQTLIHLDMKDMMWPDGSSGKNTKYSSQLLPYCAPGMEPIKGSSGVYTCTDCAVGFYKSTYGSTTCQKCPNGGDCNDVGVIIPCILPGYWRMNPPSEEELDDFVKYKIYRCDNEESCLGGCNLNISCSTDRIQSSPTCGVCAKEYYMSNGYCTKCTHTASYAPILIYFFELFGVCLILYFILNSKIKYDPQSLLIEELNSKLSIHEPPVFSSSIPMATATATASAATYLTEEEKEGKNSKDSTSPLHSLDDKKNSLSLEEESSPPPITRDDTDDDRESSLRQESFVIYQLRFFTQSISSTQVYRFTSFAIFNTFLFFQSLLPRTSVTFKLIISFWQVMTSGFFSLQISWPNNMKHFFISIIALNPFDAILATSSCTQHHMLTSYLILIIIFCLPFIFLCCLLISILVIYYFKILKYSNLLETQYQPQEYGQRLSQRWRQACYKNLWSMSTTIMVWFSLIIFAIGSATMIEFLNCRDLGTVGIYLRSDYSINCTSASYQYYKIISIFGIILFPIGIPLLFFLLIRYRYHPLLSDCAKILYGNFDKNWKYYEVYDLIRKLLLTSILLFISTPDSPSRCLYLLIIDLISLNIISYCQPYYYFYDNFLATIFIILEILSFLIGLIITSKIYQTEDYNYSAMFTTLIMMIIISILFITPMTFILKLNIIKKEYLNYLLPQNSTDTSSSTTGTTSRDERENTTPTTTSTSTTGNAHHSIKFKSITLFNENNHPQNNNNNDPEKEEDPGPPFSNTQNAHDSSPTTSTPTAYDTSTDADSGQYNSEKDLDSTSMNPSNHTFPNEGNSRNSLSFRSSWMWLPQRPNQSRNPSLSPSPDTSTNIELSNTIPTRNSECFSFPESRE